MTGKKMHGRRPADQAGDPRQTIWIAIKAREGQFTVVDIAQGTKIKRSTVYDYLKGLAVAGYLEFTEAPSGKLGQWRLIKDVGFHAPRVSREGKPSALGEGTDQMWRSMRHLKDFSFRDLIETASIEIAEATARDYCTHLLAAGYFRILTKANPAKGEVARYRLIKDTGPRAPQIQRVKRVFDPNTGDVFVREGRS